MQMPVPVQQKPIEFVVIKSDSVADIEKRVTDLFAKDFVAHGPMNVLQTTGNIIYVQAMVKIELVPMKPPPGFSDRILVPQ